MFFSPLSFEGMDDKTNLWNRFVNIQVFFVQILPMVSKLNIYWVILTLLLRGKYHLYCDLKYPSFLHWLRSILMNISFQPQLFIMQSSFCMCFKRWSNCSRIFYQKTLALTQRMYPEESIIAVGIIRFNLKTSKGVSVQK